MNRWEYSGDVNMLDYGGKFIRRVDLKRYHVVELTNMDEACGRDNEGQARYVVELSEINLQTADMHAAAQYCGLPEEIYDPSTHSYNNTPAGLLAIVEAVHSYGQKAPLESWSGNNGNALIKEAKRVSRALESDDERYLAAMNRTVNALGMTAFEYQENNIDDALVRGISQGRPEAEIIAKMQGLTIRPQK